MFTHSHTTQDHIHTHTSLLHQFRKDSRVLSSGPIWVLPQSFNYSKASLFPCAAISHSFCRYIRHTLVLIYKKEKNSLPILFILNKLKISKIRRFPFPAASKESLGRRKERKMWNMERALGQTNRSLRSSMATLSTGRPWVSPSLLRPQAPHTEKERSM